MNRGIRLLFTLGLLLITTHRLPAPISEMPEPTATAQPKAKTKPPSSAKQKAPAEKQAKMADQSVQVILSPGAQSALEYLKNNGNPDVEPNEILEQLRKVLSSRFKSVSIANDSTAQGRTGQVMVFDLQARVGWFSGQTNTVSFSGTFKDDKGNVIQTVTASGASKIPLGAFSTRFPDAVAAAFAEFSQKLGRGNRP